MYCALTSLWFSATHVWAFGLRNRLRYIRRVRFAVVVGMLALLDARAANQLAAAQWVDMRAFGPFVCRADFPLAQYDAVFNELAGIQQDLVRRLRIAPAQERIEVYLFRNRAQYDRYLNEWFPNIPYRRALYAKNNGPGIVLAYHSEELATDIRHECTHALLHASLPMVPLWLDEGLAEYYEAAPDRRYYDHPHQKGINWSLRFGRVASLVELERKRTLDQMGRGEYRSAWSWVHFLLHGPPEARDELIRYLADIHSGTPPGEFSVRLKRRLPDAERQLAKHFKSLHRN